MKNQSSKTNPRHLAMAGGGVVMLAGWLLWGTPFGDLWVRASYDNLFRFGAPAVTNQVTLILMDGPAYDQFKQSRGVPWDRALHAQLLNRLADDGAALVVMDSYFQKTNDPATDQALAKAMSRLPGLVLLATQVFLEQPKIVGDKPILPIEPFYTAARGHWGVGWVKADLDNVERQQWPFPSPGPYPSLPWAAAQLAGARLPEAPVERWVRYYGQNGSWERMSYGDALAMPPGHFKNRQVFIGTGPENTRPANPDDQDKFNTPYTSWTGEASGGVEIILATFLNLLNNESLVRPPATVEFLLLSLTGALLGWGLFQLRPVVALAVGGGLFCLTVLGGITLSFSSNYWFPWLVVAGGQIPAGLAWSLCFSPAGRRAASPSASPKPAPKIKGYQLIEPHFAEGAYGKVWLARNRQGEWRAVKVVYQAKFGADTAPFDREYHGLEKYQSLAGGHPGLLRVDLLSTKQDGRFYYVMELADGLEPGWETAPQTYQPADLASIRTKLPGRRLPVREGLKIGIQLCEAVHFLHEQGITHRDIKPQNVIFVKGQPKLADLGLLTDLKPVDHANTLVGTPGFMPPLPERPGTVAADIYALGMVLYVICSGRAPTHFPAIATTLIDAEEPHDFFPLNGIVLQACQPAPKDRYGSARDLGHALAALLQRLESREAGQQTD